MRAQQKLIEALTLTGLVQPVEVSIAGHKRASVLLRLVPGQEAAWLAVVQGLLRAYGEEVVEGHELIVARRYVLKGGRMVFGWFLDLHAPSAKELQADIEKLLPPLAEAKPRLDGPAAIPAAAPQSPPLRRATPVVVTVQQPVAGEEEIDAELLQARQEASKMQADPKTRLRPRKMESSGPDPVAPQGFTPQLRTVQSGHDDAGRVTYVQEVPLPHVYSDKNKPQHRFGRGAKPTGGRIR